MAQPTKTPLDLLLQREMSRKEFLSFGAVAVASIFGIGGLVKMLTTHAATPAAALEAELGTVTAPATIVNDTTASGGKAVKFGSSGPSSSNIYRPYTVASALDLPHAPRDANYVVYTSALGTYLHEAFQKLGANDILVLPERAAPYEIDSSAGFTKGYYSMSVAKRGLVGLGPGVIVQPSASSYRSGRVDFGSGGNQNRIIDCATSGAYFGNFEMRGRDFEGVQYDATNLTGNNAVWERLYFNGAHRGWKALPDGETGGVTGYQGGNQQVYNVEVDCRDPATGARVGASPFMFNVQTGITVVDFYGHHSIAGMPTFWTCGSITTTRLRSEFNGSGSGEIAGGGINHELVSGTVTHNNPTMLLDVNNNPEAVHISIGTDRTNAVYNINNPTFDASWDGAGIFSIDIWSYPGGNTQSDANVHVTGAPFRIHH